MELSTLVKTEIFHPQFNLEEKDNLQQLPPEKAVFGVFAIVNDEPVNCRYVGETENLREAIRNLFEAPSGVGMEKFMQGAWIQMLVYELLPGATGNDLQRVKEEWERQHQPAIDENGEYPGYYD